MFYKVTEGAMAGMYVKVLKYDDGLYNVMNTKTGMVKYSFDETDFFRHYQRPLCLMSDNNIDETKVRFLV